MRLISWNVAHRVQKLPAQIKALMGRQPDVVALQEVTQRTGPLLQNHLKQIDLPFYADTCAQTGTGSRRFGVSIASRWPFRLLSSDFEIPWPERVLSILLDSPHGPVELHTTYIPTGASKASSSIKLKTLEGIAKQLSCQVPYPRILCGDFNIPQAETEDGQVVTFAQVINGNGEVRTKRSTYLNDGQRVDGSERMIMEDLAYFDLPDAYRQVNGYQKQAFSWYWKHKGRTGGFRLDHIFASRRLNPIRCDYLHIFREQGLSDHAPLEVDFKPLRIV